MNSVIGKTIAAVEDRGHDGFEIVFTDGTRAVVVGYGYEDSAAGIDEFLDHVALRRRAADRQGEREAARLGRLRGQVAQAEEAEMRATLTAGDFEAWLDAERPGWRLKQMWSGEMMAALRDRQVMMARQAYAHYTGASFTIPLTDG